MTLQEQIGKKARNYAIETVTKCENVTKDELIEFAETDYIKGANAILEAMRWRDVISEPPPMGKEVLFFHEDWIDEDFNPDGVRIGFMEDEDFITAYYWSHQDCYMTISHSECDDNPSYSKKTKSSIDPQKWRAINLEDIE